MGAPFRSAGVGQAQGPESRDTMPTDDIRLAAARRWFPTGPLRIVRTFAAGLSGADVVLVEHGDEGGRYVLKRLGFGADRAHAAFVHRLVQHVRTRADPHIAEPAATPRGETLWQDHAGGLWELSHFVAGVPVPRPEGPQAVAAAAALARVHEAAASLPGHPPLLAVPRSLVERRRRAVEFAGRPWSRLRAGAVAAGHAAHPDLAAAVATRVSIANATLSDCGGRGMIDRLARLEPTACLVQAVLRDVWHEHVLFADQPDGGVAGFIDAQAAGIDTPITDLARLLGSWQPRLGTAHLPLAKRWPEAWQAYAAVRPLPAGAERLAQLLHAAGVVFGLDNWFRWTLEEGRVFRDANRVLDRIDRMLAELSQATAAAAAENVD